MAQLTCQNLCAGYDGRPVLQDLSFELLAGDYLCIVGENGSGKSTLMKTILGLQAPISGRILTGDGLRKNEIGYLPQQTVVSSDCSMAGISKLQMDAATITPAAKPARERCTRSPRDFFIKNTQAAPSVVPKKGIMIPRKVSICLTAFALRFYLFLLKPASSRYSGCSFTYGSWSPQMV